MSILKMAAEAEELDEEEVSEGGGLKDKIRNLWLAGSGAVLAGGSVDKIIGRKTAYHGTSRDNAERIKEEGLRANRGGSGAASLSGVEQFRRNSANQVHVSSSKPISFYYARYQGKDGNKDLYSKRKELEKLRDEVTNLQFETDNDMKNEYIKRGRAVQDVDKEMNKRFMDPRVRGGKILKVQMPFDEYDEMFIHDEDGGPKRSVAAKTGQDIGSERIVGGKGFSRMDQYKNTAKKFPSYVKKYPLRFGKGIATALAGAGLTGLGVHRLREGDVEDVEEEIDFEDII